MSLLEAIRSCIANYCCFEGRARRSEYWLFMLFISMIVIVSNFVFMYDKELSKTISILIEVAFFLPRLSVSVRRQHDIGNSGWSLLFGLIPIGGPIYILVCNCTNSEVGTNKYGPNPKESPEGMENQE